MGPIGSFPDSSQSLTFSCLRGIVKCALQYPVLLLWEILIPHSLHTLDIFTPFKNMRGEVGLEPTATATNLHSCVIAVSAPTVQHKSRALPFELLSPWWVIRDLNPRPVAYETTALTA